MIEANQLTKRFGILTALDQISFQIQSGSIFGLVGSNGAGKSTFLRTLAGIYQPDGGSVTLDGEAPFENPGVKSRIFFIPDYPYFSRRHLWTAWRHFIAACTPPGAGSAMKPAVRCSRWTGRCGLAICRRACSARRR